MRKEKRARKAQAIASIIHRSQLNIMKLTPLPSPPLPSSHLANPQGKVRTQSYTTLTGPRTHTRTIHTHTLKSNPPSSSTPFHQKKKKKKKEKKKRQTATLLPNPIQPHSTYLPIYIQSSPAPVPYSTVPYRNVSKHASDERKNPEKTAARIAL